MNKIIVIMIAGILLFPLLSLMAQNSVISPQFEQYPFLLDSSVPKLDIDFALQWTDSMEILLVAPYDAIVLHVEVDNTPKDVFIISDIGMNRLLMIQCAMGNDKSRTIEKIATYYGDDAGHLKAPSGLATNAVGRLFDPDKDAIFVADRGANRILRLIYLPNSDGGKIFYDKEFGSERLEWPIDIALTDYGTGDEERADIYIIDMGHSENTGELLKYSIYGDFEGSWGDIYIQPSIDFYWKLNQPAAIACYYNQKLESSVLCLTEKTSNSVFFLSVAQESDPVWLWSYTLQVASSIWEPGGIAIDDFGRIYVTNSMTDAIEIFSPNFEEYLPPFGEPGEGPGQFMHPSNILIDTYHDFREALVLEWYGRQSGLQTYLIDNDIPIFQQEQGFKGENLLIRQPAPLSQTPNAFRLGDAYPNPFNGDCTIEFDIPKASQVTIVLYDILGRRVATITDEYYTAGTQSVHFNSGNLASGLYFYKMNADDFSKIRSIALVK